MRKKFNYLDLFAGAGGLSEGFMRAGFNPIAHVEMDLAACFTLRTRMAYHWLKEKDDLKPYADYLQGIINREEFYDLVPDRIIEEEGDFYLDSCKICSESMVIKRNMRHSMLRITVSPK